MSKNINGSFYDSDYFENGRVTGKSWLMNYKWLPRRSFKEAFAFIDTLKLDETHYVLDFGCAKGFLVKALRELEIMADGCDISEYALSFASHGCWNCAIDEEWEGKQYTHVLAKDVFEHLQEAQLMECLEKISTISSVIMCVVPMGDNGVYRIKEYHTDLSHIIAEDETWWRNHFKAGWNIVLDINHVPGLKDNWYHIPDGNRVFVLERKC